MKTESNKVECKCGHDWEWHMPDKNRYCMYGKDITNLCQCPGFKLKDAIDDAIEEE